MTLHADARAVLAGWEPPSARDAELRDRFVAHLDAHPDAMTRACLPDHLTAGTIVLTPEADWVLLNHHRKAGVWLAFGGHPEPSDTTLAGVALREAQEESGLTDLDFDPVPLDLDEHEVLFCSPGTAVHHLDVRFLATAARDSAPRRQRGVARRALVARRRAAGDLSGHAEADRGRGRARSEQP